MALKKKRDDLGFQDAVDAVEEENLRQLDLDAPNVAEDGYIHDEKMLYGYFDEETGTLHNTFTYREMDGRDEEAINKNEVKSNGAKLANVLVERCVVQIGDFKKSDMGTKKWGTFIRNLCGGDLDYMMLKIRALSKGNTVTFTHKCPTCGAKLVTEVDCSDFKCIEFTGDSIHIPFDLPRGYVDKNGVVHKKGTIRIANGFDREIVTPLYRKNKAVATTKLFLRTMELDDGQPVSEECLKNMSVRDRDYLEKLTYDNAYGVDMTFDDLRCSVCDTDLSEVAGQSDFF